MEPLTGRTPRDQNRVPATFGVSSTDGVTALPIEINPVTRRLLVDSSGGGGGGNVNLTQVGGASIALGQTTNSASLPVAIASDSGLATAINQTNGTQQTKITDGTNVANIQSNDTGYNGLSTNNSMKVIPFTTSSSGAQTLLANTDVRGFQHVSIVTTSVGVGLGWTVPWSPNSGGTYITSQTWQDNTSAASQPGSIGTTNSKIYSSPIVAPYVQIAVSALTSGTLSGYMVLSSSPYPYHAVNCIEGGTWTVGSNSVTGSAIPANAFLMGLNNSAGNLTGVSGILPTANTAGTGVLAVGLMAQFDDVAPTTVTENNLGNLRMSADRSLLMTIQNSYAHISTAATTTVKSGAGTLHTLTVNSLGTVASTTTIYDNIAGSGTVIGIINTLTLSGPFTFDVAFTTGLTIVTTGTVAPDITVSYK